MSRAEEPPVAPSQDRPFGVGSLIVQRELWHEMLWAARPAVVVADDGNELVHWSPAGTVGCFATSRFFPGREHLPREERQLEALRTRQWHYRGFPSRGTKLTFVRDGAWSGVELTWDRDGAFAHWYVNFQLPPTRTATGYDTLDLVLDIVVASDWSWTWKDQEPFADAMRDRLFDADTEAAILDEAETIQQQIAARSGPFNPGWLDWTAPLEWQPPALPDGFADATATPPGATITLSSQPVI